MIAVVVFACALLLLPFLPWWLGRTRASEAALEASFAGQFVRVGGLMLPTSALAVVHRHPGMASYSRQGGLMQIDATWLCRAPDGTWLLAYGQGLRSTQGMALLPWQRTPLPISWSWRYPTEAQVRIVLADDPAACRRIFGTST